MNIIPICCHKNFLFNNSCLQYLRLKLLETPTFTVTSSLIIEQQLLNQLKHTALYTGWNCYQLTNQHKNPVTKVTPLNYIPYRQSI